MSTYRGNSPLTTSAFNRTPGQAIAGQSYITIPGGQVPGLNVVVVGGALLSPGDYDDSDGLGIALARPMAAGTQYDVMSYTGNTSFVPVAGQLASWRNRLTNGDMGVNNRPVLAANTSGFAVDRWSYQCSADGGAMSTSCVRTSAGFDQQRYWLRVNHSLTGGGTNSTVNLRQKVEYVDSLTGTVTVSFMGDCSVSGTIHLAMYQDFGTGGSPSALVAIPSKPIAMTPGRKKYSATFTLPTIVGKTIGTNNNDAVAVWFWFAAGASVASTFNINGGAAFSAATGSYYIGKVQLESGAVATDYEPKPLVEELSQCLRYYEPGTAIWSGNTTSGVLYYALAAFKQPKKVSPTMTYSMFGSTGFDTSTLANSGTVNQNCVLPQCLSNATVSAGYFAFNWWADGEF